MYLTLLLQGFARMRRKLWHEAVMRSGLLTMAMLILILVTLAFGWREHMLGHFGQLKRTLSTKPEPQDSPAVRPGGQDVLQLKHTHLPGENAPEFLSATLLPGRGLNVLQITAYVPQKGEVQLLSSPTLDEANRLMNGTSSDLSGGESLTMGGAIEAPWAGRILGAISADRQNLMTAWHGHRMSLPLMGADKMPDGGLLLKRASTSQNTTALPDGEEAHVVFQAGDFNGHWISQTELTSTVELSSRAIEMTIVARNTGAEAEPMGIGWQPRFALLGNREQITLRLPAMARAEVADRRTGLPSGKLLPVDGTAYDFMPMSGTRLGSLSLNDTFMHLKRGFMDNGPIVELRDPESGYGLKMTLMTSNIKAIRVSSPSNASYISLNPMFNYDDPFGREWGANEDTGMVVLQPGQSVQWKIRLEIFSLTNEAPQL